MVFFISILNGEVVGAAAAGGWRLAVEAIEGIKKRRLFGLLNFIDPKFYKPESSSRIYTAFKTFFSESFEFCT